MPRLRFRHAFTALILFGSMLVQGTWALAGTTGGLQGNVIDASTGAPIAGAAVTTVSPSQRASVTTDNAGHYVFLALNPDTYTVSVTKAGYQDASQAGATVFADQVSSQNFRMHAALRTIANVTSRAAGNLVKPGVTADTYSVNASGALAAQALGGGGNLDSAYSAMSSVPGVAIPLGGAGWNQPVFIRGNTSYFTAYEYDGIPVNRAFDNYNASTESNLGLQELQVYTGGGPASISSAGTAGFINQVIKTGTYPGFGTLNGSISTPQFYHEARVEAGGASPNRNFSYYVGLSGYNQDFNFLDNSNGASLFRLGGTYDFSSEFSALMFFNTPAGSNERGVWPICGGPNGLTSPIVGTQPFLTNPSCFFYDPAAALYSQAASISDRENVVNLHLGIPMKNGQRDDLQLLWGASSLNSTEYSSPNDAGGIAKYTAGVTGSPYCPASGFYNGAACTPNYPSYVDIPFAYNLPFGTPIQPNGVPLPTQQYLQPSSPQNREALAQVPADLRDSIFNDTGVAKIQYTHSLGANAYARLFGYTFFSDWTQAGANGAFNAYEYGIGGPTTGGTVAANYDLITHTAGGELQLADQITPKHLVQFTLNYTTATVSRFNNNFWAYYGGGTPVGYVASHNGVYTCYDPSTGDPSDCLSGAARSSAGAGPYPVAAPGTPAALAGAQWVTLTNGDTSGTFNTVKPKFTFMSLTDDFRPSDRLDFNLGLRFDNYLYDLAPLTPGTQFFAQIIPQDVCQNGTGQLLTKPLAPGQSPPAPVIYTSSCPAGYFHPQFTATSPSTYTLRDLAPRASFTYTVDPRTVIRGEVGRYTQPPISASLQYLNSSGNALSVWQATLPLGFHTPFHPIPLMSTIQSDLSIEHQFNGTDITAKLSPFFNYTAGYQQQSFIGPNFVTQVPVGQFRSYGTELAISKGDFNRDGLSGQLALTYTNAKIQFQNKYFGANQLNSAGAAIQQFNALTKAGGGAACYTAANATTGTPGVATSCGTPGAIANPYYNMSPQPIVDPNGWYSVYSTGLSPTNNPQACFCFDSPFVTSLILNYKHQRWSITPSFQLSEGSSYGGPLDVAGLDPRACAQNSAMAGITAVSPGTNPNQCNYLQTFAGNVSPNPVAGQLFIPNPQTGKFAIPGQYRNPWVALLNIQARYDISPKITLIGTFANVWHTCFGGDSEPWTKANPPGPNVCGYAPNVLYTSNFYNGTSATDVAANGVAAQKWQQNSYLPEQTIAGGFGSPGSSIPFPFNAYFQVQIKL